VLIGPDGLGDWGHEELGLALDRVARIVRFAFSRFLSQGV
jgi:hypothetical protein